MKSRFETADERYSQIASEIIEILKGYKISFTDYRNIREILDRTVENNIRL